MARVEQASPKGCRLNSVPHSGDALGSEPAPLDGAQQATLQVPLHGWCQTCILACDGDGVRVLKAGGGKCEQVSDAVRLLFLSTPHPALLTNRSSSLRLVCGRKSRRIDHNSLYQGVQHCGF